MALINIVLTCRWQAEQDPTYALFEAALRGATSAAAAPTSARDAKLQKAKGRVGIFIMMSSMQYMFGQHPEGRCKLPACVSSLCVLSGVRRCSAALLQ